jgi:hypothetical protein
MHAIGRRKISLQSLRKGIELLPHMKIRIITSHEEKAKAVFDFYSNLIGADSSRDRTINLDGLALPRHELDVLETPFSEEEVWNTIKKFAI